MLINENREKILVTSEEIRLTISPLEQFFLAELDNFNDFLYMIEVKTVCNFIPIMAILSVYFAFRIVEIMGMTKSNVAYM